MLQPRYLFTQDFSVFRTALLSLPHRVRRFERGESLWAAGTPFEKIFFFDAGLARTSIISVSGSNRVIAWQGPGTMFPVIHRNRFEIETRHLTEAVTAVAALEFSAVDIEAYLRGSADFALATIDWYAKFVNLLLYSAADVSTSPNTLTALASTLLLLFRNEAGAVMATNNLLKITQSELAALLGVDRASLVRALSALRKKGAVATLRGAIISAQKYCSRLLPALNPSCIEQYFLGSARFQSGAIAPERGKISAAAAVRQGGAK